MKSRRAAPGLKKLLVCCVRGYDRGHITGLRRLPGGACACAGAGAAREISPTPRD